MKKFLSLLLSLCMMITLFSCGNSNATQTEVEPIEDANATTEAQTEIAKEMTFKIGGLGPLTGGAAVYGTAVKNGTQLAIDEINAQGGINGYMVEYKCEDDEHDVEKAVNGYNSLKDWGMQLLIGTTTSSPCIAVAAESFNDNIFQITPSGTAADCVANPNVYRVCFSDPNQGIASAEAIKNMNLGTKIGVIYDSSDVYSSGIYEKFVETCKSNGIEIVAEESFTADSKTDFTTQLNKIKEAGADLLFMPFYYTEIALLLTQAETIGFKPKYLSCDGLDGILSLPNFNKSLAEDVMLLIPFSSNSTDDLTVKFVDEYKKRHNEVPNQFAADAYDAAFIVKQCLENTAATPNSSPKEILDICKEQMSKISFTGLTGHDIEWSQDGEPQKDPLIAVIKNGEYELINE